VMWESGRKCTEYYIRSTSIWRKKFEYWNNQFKEEKDLKII
jgi:hypothetical protein